ncbi:MAG TPA: lipase maturation factor family protein [Thermoanaerobaculia bacterium]|jgi:hypothetical protein|nr:lipase maturation factor family protein [Thermoanaerobaculia bacterium]
MFEEFTPPRREPLTYVRAKWLWLRALGLIFFSAFYSLWFQIHGLIGSRGVLPAREYLALAKRVAGAKAYWLAPTVLWANDSDAMLTAIVVAGAIASIALTFNFLPRTSIAVAMICFLSFIGAAQDFASYQSDGMLLEAAFLSLFLGRKNTPPPPRLARFVLVWEWFRIYFESGLVKIFSGEQQWRNLTAMDKYYENGPLPTWIGWYAQQLPHSFHAATAAATLLIELFIVWFGIFPSRWSRVTCFAICTLLQIGIIATANYAFLNYLVLALGVWLLDDKVLCGAGNPAGDGPNPILRLVLIAHLITTSVMFFFPSFPLAVALGPTRIVNNFGLFAVMTRARFEIEFQGTHDGKTWIAYPFRYKPQDVKKAPGIYAPYQPRFDWNLWFASLGPPEDNPFVMNTESRLMEGSPQVLELFAGNPFAAQPPIAVRAVLWQYWFTTRAERARSGAWWNRRLVGLYAP